MIGRKILAVVGLGTVVGALYGKHVYDTLKTDIMYKLYNGEELDEHEKEFMRKSSEFRENYKELKAKNKKVEEADKTDEAGKTVDNTVEETFRQAEETFRQQQQVVEQVNTQAVEQTQQQM